MKVCKLPTHGKVRGVMRLILMIGLLINVSLVYSMESMVEKKPEATDAERKEEKIVVELPSGKRKELTKGALEELGLLKAIVEDRGGFGALFKLQEAEKASEGRVKTPVSLERVDAEVFDRLLIIVENILEKGSSLDKKEDREKLIKQIVRDLLEEKRIIDQHGNLLDRPFLINLIAQANFLLAGPEVIDEAVRVLAEGDFKQASDVPFAERIKDVTTLFSEKDIQKLYVKYLFAAGPNLWISNITKGVTSAFFAFPLYVRFKAYLLDPETGLPREVESEFIIDKREMVEPESQFLFFEKLYKGEPKYAQLYGHEKSGISRVVGANWGINFGKLGLITEMEIGVHGEYLLWPETPIEKVDLKGLLKAAKDANGQNIVYEIDWRTFREFSEFAKKVSYEDAKSVYAQTRRSFKAFFLDKNVYHSLGFSLSAKPSREQLFAHAAIVYQTYSNPGRSDQNKFENRVILQRLLELVNEILILGGLPKLTKEESASWEGYLQQFNPILGPEQFASTYETRMRKFRAKYS